MVFCEIAHEFTLFHWCWLFKLKSAALARRVDVTSDRADGITATASARSGDVPLVLVIDDDPAAVASLAMMLEDHGFRVLTAQNGFHGLRVFSEQKPAAVLTDVIMPEKDGIETIMELRRTYPDTKIIALSGRFRSWTYLATAKKLGADAAFEKGRNPKPLIETLKKLLNQQ
jgi:DNA-binding response OmpR family regulator